MKKSTTLAGAKKARGQSAKIGNGQIMLDLQPKIRAHVRARAAAWGESMSEYVERVLGWDEERGLTRYGFRALRENLAAEADACRVSFLTGLLTPKQRRVFTLWEAQEVTGTYSSGDLCSMADASDAVGRMDDE